MNRRSAREMHYTPGGFLYLVSSRSGYVKRTMILLSFVIVAHWVGATEDKTFAEFQKEDNGAGAVVTAAELENLELRNQLSVTRESIKALTGSLVAAKSETASYREKYLELARRDDALGLEALTKDQAKVEQRLLNAVSDLRLTQKDRNQYRDQMLALSEAMVRLLKTSTGGEALARMEVEAQLRAVDKMVCSAQNLTEETPTLLDGKVVSVKEEWSLVVGNIGEKQGVRVGMPLRVTRDDRLIAMLQVVDVRQKICGAVIQEMECKKINVGDRLQVDVVKREF